MDYPFYLLKFAQLPESMLKTIYNYVDFNNVANHPHFSAERNPGAYRLGDENNTKVVELITDFLNQYIQKTALYWNEINVLTPSGIIAEHSDLAYAGYNKKGGTPQEIVLTHKVHVHLHGNAELNFRRSKYEPIKTFTPDIGGCYWYNNYVLHSSKNPSSTVNRVALSLIYHDPKWIIRQNILDKHNFKFQSAYQL